MNFISIKLLQKKRKKEKGKECWRFSEGSLFSEHGAACNYFISLVALTTGKLKAKYESGSVQGPTEHLVYSLHLKFILFFFYPDFPFAPVSSLPFAECGYNACIFKATLKHFWNKAKCVVINRSANNSQLFGLFDEKIKAL